MKVFKEIMLLLLLSGAAIFLLALIINLRVISVANKYILSVEETLPEVDTVIVLGALVFPSGNVSLMLGDRLEAGLRIYGKSTDRILVSGDHGNKNYDEVRAMKDYLLRRDVPEEHIFMDHAGFSTYDTVYRAKEIFLVSSAVISTQKYHLYRALYTARVLGIEAYGIAADTIEYPQMPYYRFREALARVKDFIYVHLHVKPVYLGPVIDIRGSGLATED